MRFGFWYESDGNLTLFLQVLQNTRGLLLGKYKQIPQLSVGTQVDLNQPLKF